MVQARGPDDAIRRQVTQFSTRPPLKLRICLVPTYGKQLDTGEMLVGPANVFLMDETSNGLDSSTTYRITNFLGQMVNSMDLTMVISLLKPDPETYKLFYDVILMSKGQIVYQGMAMFFRTAMHVGSLEDGIKFFGALFFGLLIVMFNGMVELSLIVVRLLIFYKQRDSLLYPAWAFAIPIWLLRIPLSLMESGIWVVLTYYNIGFAPDATRFSRQFLTFFAIHQMALSLFRLISTVARTEMTLQAMDVMGILCFSMYAQNALVIDEFLDKRWSRIVDEGWGGVGVGEGGGAGGQVGGGFRRSGVDGGGLGKGTPTEYISRVFYFRFETLGPFPVAIVDAKHVISEESYMENTMDDRRKEVYEGIDMAVRSTSQRNTSALVAPHTERRGMVLPFQPLSLAFSHVNYYIDTPIEMKHIGFKENRMQLLRDVSGALRPEILTALIGVSGAGKTSLMDVLAGRKTDIFISGYPKNQSTFARLRLSSDVNTNIRKIFFDELMELVELLPLRNAMLRHLEISCRLTDTHPLVLVLLVEEPPDLWWLRHLEFFCSDIVKESCSNRHAYCKNTVDTGRTVLCIIHQPSIDIFESFAELLLMKIGGQIIFAGTLGHQSHKLVEYFQAIPGVPKIRNGYNPATWALDLTSSAEIQLNVDYAQIYANSALYEYIPKFTFSDNQLQDLLDLSGGLYAVVLFLGAVNINTVQPIVAVERTVFYRERAAGMYSSLPYALSQLLLIKRKLESIHVEENGSKSTPLSFSY
ncbi:plant PDR ABC transporter associated protein [Tanacetum coccineum]